MLPLKVPTAAHRAIADLVKAGYIRVVLTTNFDRLLEKALEDVGVVPTVISTPDTIVGALPLTHTRCSIVKVHGDYLDTRIKNTPTELEKYDEQLDHLLNRVFDEFGLIVCGWSAEWDVALRAAIERCPSRRFTTFWAARRVPKGTAKDLMELRSAAFISIQDANSFFQDLSEKVSSLEELARPHPLSAKVAVATLKKYLVDERYRIRLHDLVTQEVEKLYKEISPDYFPLGTPFNAVELNQRVERCESLTEILLAVMSTGCYWGEQLHQYLWVDSLDRIANPPDPTSGVSYFKVWRKLSLYPVLLLLYAGGIASLAAEQYSTFAALLLKPQVRDPNRSQPLVLSLNTWAVMEQDVGQKLPGMDRHHTPLSDHLYEVLRETLRGFLPQDIYYQRCFDRFEYLSALVHVDLNLREGGFSWGPVGSFGWRRRSHLGNQDDIVREIENEATTTGQDWPPLQVGLFNGSLENFRAAKASYDQHLKEVSWL